MSKIPERQDLLVCVTLTLISKWRRLPETQLAERPKAIIAYAQESRMALLKLVALLRWKEQADVPKTIRTTKDGNGGHTMERQGDLQTAWVSINSLRFDSVLPSKRKVACHARHLHLGLGVTLIRL